MDLSFLDQYYDSAQQFTNIIFAPAISFAASLANSSGLPEDQTRYLICLVFLTFLGLVYKNLPDSPTIKHLFSIFVSVSCAAFALGPLSWIHAFISSTVAYFILKFLPHGVAHKVVFVWAMGYMSASHIYRMYIDYMGWSMDFTGPQMMLTIKLTSFACNYYDGHCKEEELPKRQAEKEYLQRHSVRSMPSLLEFFGFIFFFPSFLAGPTLEYTDYITYVKAGSKIKVPSTIVPALLKMGQALLVLPGTLISMFVFPLSFLTTQAYFALPIWDKIFRCYFYTALIRQKYYFGWYLAEASFISCGISYYEKENEPRWDKYTPCYPLKVEFGLNTRMLTENWNISVASWLKYYVYIRLLPLGGSVATLGTYTISAFWHGFYPGYYMFFVLSGFQTVVARGVRNKWRPMFVKRTDDGKEVHTALKPVYDVAGIIVTQLFTNFGGGAFGLLSWQYGYQLWKTQYFYGVVILLSLFVWFSFISPPKRSPRPKPKAQ